MCYNTAIPKKNEENTMIRKIIHIDREKCNGCGLCVTACHEGAIGMVDGKAMLLREDFCDGLGDCLPACPTGAITFEEREAKSYNEEAVKEAQAKARPKSGPLPCGCPGTMTKAIARQSLPQPEVSATASCPTSRLSQWPVQIKLVAPNAPYFDSAHLLVAADCTAFAYGNFHNEFIKNKICLIGCPKLDSVDYSEKLTAILENNDIKSVTVVRMEVPCCGGIENAVKQALKNSGKWIPWQVVTISIDGRIVE